MKRIRWKVESEGRMLASGQMEATDDKECLGRLLLGEGGFAIEPNRCYQIQAGELVTSSFGDEFELTAGAITGLDDIREKQGRLQGDGYIHPSKPAKPVYRQYVVSGMGYPVDLKRYPPDFLNSILDDTKRTIEATMGVPFDEIEIVSVVHDEIQWRQRSRVELKYTVERSFGVQPLDDADDLL